MNFYTSLEAIIKTFSRNSVDNGASNFNSTESAT